MNKVHFSTGKDDWETPPELFAQLDAEFHFDIDVCANRGNTKCPYFYGPGSPDGEDGLTTYWVGQTCWMNPPYSTSAAWIVKGYNESQKGATVVCLLPARTDTRCFHEVIWDTNRHCPRPGVEVRFLKGRLKFVGAAHPAPFPSMVVIFKPLI